MINSILKRGKIIKTLLILFGVSSLIVMVYNSGIGSYFTLENMKIQSVYFQQLLAHSYFKVVIYYCLIYTILITLTLPVVGPLTILGGYLFGLFPGFLFALFCACLGSTCSFLCLRYFFSSLIRNRYKAKLERFNEKIKVYGFSYLLTLHLLSVVPYVVINALAALANVPLGAFLWTTIVGSIPLIFIYALAGQQLGTIESMRDILSPHIILMLAMLAGLALIPMILKRFKYGEV